MMIQKKKQNNHVFMFSQDFCVRNSLQLEHGAYFEGVWKDYTSPRRYVCKLSLIEARMISLEQFHSWGYIDLMLLTPSVLGCSLLNIPIEWIVGRLYAKRSNDMLCCVILFENVGWILLKNKNENNSFAFEMSMNIVDLCFSCAKSLLETSKRFHEWLRS